MSWFAVIRDVHLLRAYDCSIRTVSKLVRFVASMNVRDWFISLDLLDSFLLDTTRRRATIKELWVWETTLEVPRSQAMFVHKMNTLLKREWECWFIDSDAYAFRGLHQIFSFAKRVSLTLPELEDAAFSQWWSIYKGDKAPLPQMEAARAIRAVIEEWFPKAKEKTFYEGFVPSHGPGQVAEKCKTKDEKFMNLFFSPFQSQFLDEHNLWEKIGYGLMQQPFWSKDVVDSWRSWVTKMVFVNKSWKTYRTISMEPVTTQWLQHGLFSCFTRFVKSRQTGFSNYYMLDTEHWNRTLCEIGSLDGSYATIDCSAASDCVTWPLVRYCFENTCLWDGLYATRTPYVQYRDDIYEQTMFAPMGSTMCFPVETIVFAACVEVATRELPYDKNVHSRNAWPNGCVYGDDIVCLAILVTRVMQLLHELGFIVNIDKSFTTCQSANYFRESCGAEYLNGVDVAPVRLSRTFPGFTVKPENCVPNLVAMANVAFDHNMTTLRLMLVDHLRSVCPDIYFDDGRNGLKSNGSLNYHLTQRWNDDYQCVEVLSTRVYVEKMDRIQWMRESFLMEHPDLVQEEIDRIFGRSASCWSDSARLFEWLRLRPRASLTADGRCIPMLYPEQEVHLDTSAFNIRTSIRRVWSY
jgi:hypothetical protein